MQVRAVDQTAYPLQNISSFVGHGLMNGAAAPCICNLKILARVTDSGFHTHTPALFQKGTQVITW